MNWLHHCLVAASQRSFKYTRYCSIAINLLYPNNIPVICFGKVALFKSNISYPLRSIINTRWPFFFCAALSSSCSNMHPMEKYICYPPSKTDEGQAVNLLQLFVFPARSLGMGCFVSVNVVSVEVQPFQFINIWECKANQEKKNPTVIWMNVTFIQELAVQDGWCAVVCGGWLGWVNAQRDSRAFKV